MALLFEQKAPGIMQKLMADFGFTALQAAGIVGNLGTETAGFKHMQEIKPVVPGSAGGFGWAQWTGPRRKAFFAWAKAKGLDVYSDAANYGFLAHEMRTSEKATVPAVKRTSTLDTATVAFERAFERAGVKHYDSRKAYALRALKAYEAAIGDEPAIPAPPDIEPPEEEPSRKNWWKWLPGLGGLGGLGSAFAWVDTATEFLIVGTFIVVVAGGVYWFFWGRK